MRVRIAQGSVLAAAHLLARGQLAAQALAAQHVALHWQAVSHPVRPESAGEGVAACGRQRSGLGAGWMPCVCINHAHWLSGVGSTASNGDSVVPGVPSVHCPGGVSAGSPHTRV